MTVAPPLPLESYWAEFEVDDSDIELVYNLMLEREAPLTAGEMSAEIIAGRIDRLRRQAEEAAKPEHTAYRPGDRYEAGTQLSFPALQGKVGVVTAVRQGENPGLGAFEVIAVSFDDDGGTREFASSLEEHALNQVPDASEDQDQLLSPEGVLSAYGPLIEARLTAHLEQQEDIVRIAWRWFPRALLAEIHEGHLNLAEAVLDVASGGPLPTTSLLEHIELPDTVDPLLAAFSLDYALQEDERFDEVGPAGEVLWFLQRNEPPEVLYTPSRLQFEPIPYNRNLLTPDLLDLERRLDDELNPQEGPVEEASELTYDPSSPPPTKRRASVLSWLMAIPATSSPAGSFARKPMSLGWMSGTGAITSRPAVWFGFARARRRVRSSSRRWTAVPGAIGSGRCPSTRKGKSGSPCSSSRWGRPMMN